MEPDDVLPYFRRAEHQTRGPDEFHGTDGPLCVSDVPDHHPICQAFIDASTYSENRIKTVIEF